MKYILSKEWLRNLCFWLLSMSVAYLGNPLEPSRGEALVLAVTFSMFYAASWTNNRLLHHFLASKKNVWLYLISLISVLAMMVFVQHWGYYNVAFASIRDEPWTVVDSVIDCFGFLMVGFGVNSAYREIMRLQTSLETELLTKQNELRFLQNQVNPHFLFNSLNNLYSSSIAEPSKVSGHILQMADLLRYQLSSAKREFVPLADEVDFLKNYMDVEARRLGRQVVLVVEMTGDFDGKNIAPLLFLPFLENAFKYSTGGISAAKIEVSIKSEANRVQFFVKNSVPENVASTPISTGIGIENAQKRLELLYPTKFDLSIKPAEREFLVDLKINL